MTALDHLRAVLAVTNDKAYRTADEQHAIELARRFIAHCDASAEDEDTCTACDGWGRR